MREHGKPDKDLGGTPKRGKIRGGFYFGEFFKKCDVISLNLLDKIYSL